jgi:EAL domain-containing protein (putative c-di-GMP-specific phosphodiesterase class I)
MTLEPVIRRYNISNAYPYISLKSISHSFVHDIASNSGDQVIVRTIIAMATSLGLKVIAEGVETEEQRHLLFINGCTLYQGYLFGEPLPIEQFNALHFCSKYSASHI